MTVAELLAVLIYFPPDDCQDVEVRINGAQLSDVRVIDNGGKLRVEMTGSPAVRTVKPAADPASRLQALIDAKNRALADLQSELDKQASTKAVSAPARRSTSAALNSKQVFRTISDRNEIAKITKSSATRQGYLIR